MVLPTHSVTRMCTHSLRTLPLATGRRSLPPPRCLSVHWHHCPRPPGHRGLYPSPPVSTSGLGWPLLHPSSSCRGTPMLRCLPAGPESALLRQEQVQASQHRATAQKDGPCRSRFRELLLRPAALRPRRHSSQRRITARRAADRSLQRAAFPAVRGEAGHAGGWARRWPGPRALLPLTPEAPFLCPWPVSSPSGSGGRSRPTGR